MWLSLAIVHRKVGPVSRIRWEWRGHAIVRPQARFIAPLVMRPAVSTMQHCAIYFTTTSARGSCTNRLLLSFAKTVRSCKLSWSSMHHPHLQAAHHPHPPMPMVQDVDVGNLTFPEQCPHQDLAGPRQQPPDVGISKAPQPSGKVATYQPPS